MFSMARDKCKYSIGLDTPHLIPALIRVLFIPTKTPDSSHIWWRWSLTAQNLFRLHFPLSTTSSPWFRIVHYLFVDNLFHSFFLVNARTIVSRPISFSFGPSTLGWYALNIFLFWSWFWSWRINNVESFGLFLLTLSLNLQGASKKTFFSENWLWQILLLIMRNPY